MNKQKILGRKRLALWRAYSKKCIYCGEPVRYPYFWVEHVIPEHLLNKPVKLRETLKQYGLPLDFSLNDYPNWVATCSKCNKDKGASILEPISAHHYLSIAKRKAQKAVVEERKIKSHMKADKMLSKLEIAIEDGLISRDQVTSILQRCEELSGPDYDQFVICFCLRLEDVYENEAIGEDVPKDHPHLCDWLEEDLVKQLKKRGFGFFYYPECSARNGETLSVRLAFLNLNLEGLDKFDSDLWEILEVAYYSELYGELPERQIPSNDGLTKGST